MHLKIAHQLSLLLAAIVVLVVISIGGLTVWNLRSGFNDYLRVRDDEQLMRLVKLVERRAAVDPQLNWLRTNEREAMRELMDDFYERPYRPQGPPGPQSAASPADAHRRGPPDRAHGPRAPWPPPDGPNRGHPWAPPGPPPPADIAPEQAPVQTQRPPPPQPPPVGGAGALRDRVLIRDAQGQWVAGREQATAAAKSVRAIKVNQIEVGTMSLVAEPMPDTTDLSFLRRQYQGLGLAALGTVLVALLAGFWLASLWSRPLRALQQASRAIAQGKRDTHVEPAGALEMAELAADINAMTAELARLETTRRTWIAQISHELRTPLSVLRGEIESIEDGVRQPTPAMMGRLRDEVMQLTRLVDDLHTLSVADVDGMRCTFSPGMVGPALEDVVQRFQAQAQQLGLTLHYLPPDNAPQLTAEWDFGRIEQLLANLLTNSLRYTQAPGRITVSWQRQNDHLLLSVEDTAPGVSDADLPRLFDPLFRADASRQRTADTRHASGLGLSIVRSIALAHRGQVSVQQSALGGLAVHVTLPLCPEQVRAKSPPQTKAGTP